MLDAFQKIAQEKGAENRFFYYCSSNDDKSIKLRNIHVIRLKECDESWFLKYDVFISVHCKQKFPKEMVEKYRCINIHPGLNPYNRGWFPHVFSILNGLPIGVTIHEMDAELDHGPIIYQREIKAESFETSEDIYQRILQTEIEMIREYFFELITGEYIAVQMNEEGNLNYKKNFTDICELDLGEKATMREHLNLLRALTFSGYNNAFYKENGRTVYVKVSFEVEER